MDQTQAKQEYRGAGVVSVVPAVYMLGLIVRSENKGRYNIYEGGWLSVIHAVTLMVIL